MAEPQAPLTEREQFETWCDSLSFRTERYGSGYHDTKTNRAWLAWQARAALSTAPVQGVLTEALLAVFDHLAVRDDDDGNAPGHSHAVPGIWDRDNGLKSGAVCGWCNKWARAKRLRAALASAPHPPSNTLGDALAGQGDPVTPTSEASRDL